MKVSGPIIVIEDDVDDQELMSDVFTELGLRESVFFFKDGQEALDHLNQTHVIPFLILSDINMPRLDGLALRNKIKTDAKLELKCIPYLFFTTASNQQVIIDAYSMSVQGFFIKQNTFAELKDTIEAILKYWVKCSSPNRS